MLTRLDISAYKRIYDKNPMAVAVVTLLKNKDGEVNDFVYEYTNQAMANIDGIKASDIIGKKYSNEDLAYYNKGNQNHRKQLQRHL